VDTNLGDAGQRCICQLFFGYCCAMPTPKSFDPETLSLHAGQHPDSETRATGPTTSPTVTHKNPKTAMTNPNPDRESCNRQIEHKRKPGHLFDPALPYII
jgi:hypothetical protein